MEEDGTGRSTERVTKKNPNQNLAWILQGNGKYAAEDEP